MYTEAVPLPSFEFQLYTIGLINAILNSFSLEDRVEYRRELESTGFLNVLQRLEDKIEGINTGYFTDGLEVDPLIAKMEEHLELYHSVEARDMREATLGHLDITNPMDLFEWLIERSVEDGFLSELTHVLQCCTTIPRNAYVCFG